MVELIIFRSLFDLYTNSFELFCAETIVYISFLFGLLHAYKNGPENMLFIFIALAAASFVDPFCLISENIRNYFHSHASILLYDRHVAPWQFPLFACIAYVPGAPVWALKLPIIPETCLIVFVASWTFYCFDLFACRWLLYQWHVSDPLYSARTECVPLASSMWVMAYAATASLLARLSYRYITQTSKISIQTFDYTWWAAFFVSTFLFLPLHILPISVFYFPPFYLNLNKEYECVWVFGLLGLFLAMLTSNSPPPKGYKQTSMFIACIQSFVWFGGLLFVLTRIDPGTVLSTSVHQPYGGLNRQTSYLCSKTETYLFGMSSRKRYVCDEDLTYWKTVPNPNTHLVIKPTDEWYTIQGKPMDQTFFIHYLLSVTFGIGVHILLFLLAKSTESNIKQA